MRLETMNARPASARELGPWTPSFPQTPGIEDQGRAGARGLRQ